MFGGQARGALPSPLDAFCAQQRARANPAPFDEIASFSIRKTIALPAPSKSGQNCEPARQYRAGCAAGDVAEWLKAAVC
jgi:hypothetical protein